MSETTVNVPLLRKAVEWAEAEAAKPWELSEWNQQITVQAPEFAWPSDYDIAAGVAEDAAKSPECGTCFCVAGYVVQVVDGPHYDGARMPRAAELLGLDHTTAMALFGAENSIADVREIAESIAGERL